MPGFLCAELKRDYVIVRRAVINLADVFLWYRAMYSTLALPQLITVDASRLVDFLTQFFYLQQLGLIFCSVH